MPSKPITNPAELDAFSKPLEDMTLDDPCQLFEKLSLNEKS